MLLDLAGQVRRLFAAIGLVDIALIQHTGDQNLAHHLPLIQGTHALHGDADAVHDGHVILLAASDQRAFLSGNVLYTLTGFGVIRFNEMKKYIGSISYKTLSSALKELEADGLVHREEYPQIPPKVEYSLTERGKSLIPILDQMCTWGEEHRMV